MGNRVAGIAVTLAILVLLIPLAFMLPGMMGMGYGPWGGMPGMGLVVLVLAVIGTILIGRALLDATAAGDQAGGTGPEKPLAILQRRLAKGEISREEYEDLRKTLGA